MEPSTKWNIDDKFKHLDVEFDGLRVRYKGPGRNWFDSAMIRANNPIPQCELFYFEVKIIDEGENGIIGIGFCEKTTELCTLPGWGDYSWGYRGDNGNIFCHSGGACEEVRRGQELYELERIKIRKARLNCPDLERMRFEFFWNEFLCESTISEEKELKRIFLEVWPKLKFEEGLEWFIKESIIDKNESAWEYKWKPRLKIFDFEIFEKEDLLFLKLKSDDEITLKIKDLERNGEDDLRRLERELRVFSVGKSIRLLWIY
ncbi:SPRY-domain-containing protein [Gigaspora margarita]|uniref:SPRY-domain-containing protein n=1 Tax=Gigaspora margarita TaxID=4874 RepID=A0A8H4AFW9_GIGMA|nr:SPRY-domain-containing protein [Gigaspora margarita]